MKKKDYYIIGSLLFLNFIPFIAGSVRLISLWNGGSITRENQRFFDDPVPIIIHIVGVMVFGIIGAFQFSPGIRHENLRWHKLSGRILVLIGLISSFTGLWLTWFYPKVETDGDYLFSIRIIVGTWMTLCIILGLFFILQKNIESHKNWMTRGYAIGMGAGTQVFTHLPWFILMENEPSGISRDLLMGAGWLINFCLAEWLVWTKRIK